MNAKIENYLIIIAYVILTIALFTCAVENIESPWIVIFISLGIIAIFTLRQIVIAKNMYNKIYYVYICVQVVLIFILSLVSSGTWFILFYFVIIYDFIFEKEGFSFIFFAILCYCLSLVGSYCNVNESEVLNFYSLAFYNLVLFSFTTTIVYLLKYICRTNDKLQIAKNQLSIKNIELRQYIENMRQAYEKNEDYLVLNERNKFAREIHDTVGHTLTTALVEMEASKVLMEKSEQEAEIKLDSALEQVRRGLKEVRTSVRALGEAKIDYYNEVIELIKNSILHADVAIRYDIDDFSNENEITKRCIFRALQEGITNGIRHGAATAFLFKLKYDKNFLRFSLENNGKGMTQIQKGFGLKAMEERVREANGVLNIITDIDEGFNIYINFKLRG
ncbi:sensor histidine kinase [Clostridium hydrogenum]|uniref:sensor histidine kinase n=1 Tax=Clostridium hydrogenum TaxID=2855764 RepID=UPI001F238452|nr:sensor histidine kinase [Clostridium hydrogenum]